MSGDVIIFTVSRLFDGPGAVRAAAVSPAGGSAGLPPPLPRAGETIREGENDRQDTLLQLLSLYAATQTISFCSCLI